MNRRYREEGGEHRKAQVSEGKSTTSPVEQNENFRDLGPGLAQGPSQVTPQEVAAGEGWEQSLGTSQAMGR